MRTLYLKLLAYLQVKCAHPAEAVAADIEEGARPDHCLQWCCVCGAYRHAYFRTTLGGCGAWFKGEWERPRPDLHAQLERRQYLADLAASK
jgi:hypothetical protein